MRKIFLHRKLKILYFSIIIVVAVSVSAQRIFAVWSGTFYNPGDTLNPECLPTDSECDVLIFPSQTGNSGKYLTTDGTSTSWSSVAGGLADIVDDTTPQLGGDLDLNGNVITGMVIGTNIQAYDADLTTYAGITPSSNVQTLLGSADYSAFRTSLGVAIGSDVQAYNSKLANFVSSNLALASNTFSASSGAITITPASGSNLNISLATTGDFAVNTDDLYVDTSAGYVGVGTTSPLKGFHVQQGGSSALTSAYGNGLLFSTNNASGARIFLESTSNSSGERAVALVNEAVGGTGTTYFGSLSNDGSSWVNNYILVMKNTSGYVGLNTSGPDRRLDVLDASNPQLRLTYTDGSVYTDFQTDASGSLAIVPTNSLITTTASIRPTTDNTYTLGEVQNYEWSSVATRDISGNNRRFRLNTSSNTAILQDHTTVGTSVQILHRGSVAGQFGDGSGNAYVGINTGGATPSDPLTVYTNGNDKGFRLVNSSTGNPILRVSRDGASDQAEFFLYKPSGVIQFAIRPGNPGYINTGQNFGIGTTTPTAKLDITQSLTGSDASSALAVLPTWNTTGTPTAFKINVTDTSSSISSYLADFQVGGSSKFNITKGGVGYFAGNVGIKTASPDGSLHILTSSAGSVTGHSSGSDLVVENSSDGGISILGGTSSTGSLIFGDGSSNYRGALRYSHSSDSMSFTTAGTQQGVITSAGYLGLSTSGPDRRLDVLDTSAAQLRLTYTDGSVYTDFQTDSSGYLTITPSGGVLNVYSPTNSVSSLSVGQSLNFSANLNTSTTRHAMFTLSRIGTPGTPLVYIGAGSGPTSTSTVIASSNDNLIFGYDTSGNFNETMRLTTDKNVGIGTSSPSILLHVKSTSDTNILRLEDSDGTCDHDPESGSETVSCSSDERLKTNIVDTGSAIAYFSDFRIRDYNVIASGDLLTGVIAQEVQEIHPELVALGDDGYFRVVQPNPWQIIKAIQELDIRLSGIENLEEATTFIARLREWLGSIENGISQIYASIMKSERVETQELCIDDLCITKDQLQQIIDNQGSGTMYIYSSGGESSNDDTGGDNTSGDSNDSGDDTSDTGDTSDSGSGDEGADDAGSGDSSTDDSSDGSSGLSSDESSDGDSGSGGDTDSFPDGDSGDSLSGGEVDSGQPDSGGSEA